MVIPILSVEDVRKAEQEANDRGVTYDAMMQRAGGALAARLAAMLEESGAPASDWRVTLLIGPGNNGGDGLVAGRLLAAETRAQVHFYLLKPRAETDPHWLAVQEAGLFVAQAEDDQRFRVLQQLVSTSLIVVDALFGIGARLPLGTDVRKLLSAVRAALDTGQSQQGLYVFADQPQVATVYRPRVLAVDCPSGLDCDSGLLDEATLHADETMTMIAAKPGLLTFPGAARVGRLSVTDLGLPASLSPIKSANSHLVSARDAGGLLPHRLPDGHKGTYGRVLVVGGSANYAGAPALAARAAYRMGAGLVTIGMPGPVAEWLAGALQECTWLHLPHDLGALSGDGAALIQEHAAASGALVLGMGLGRDPASGELLERLLRPADSYARPAIGFVGGASGGGTQTPPALPALILDADALSLLTELPDWPTKLPPGTILTPHPGEMARLCGLSVREVVNNRWEVACTKAQEWGVVLVLKGAHTLIASPEGALRVLPFKTSALATAGTGDVLAGVIGALRAGGLSAFDAASTGAYVHGLAGTLAGAQLGSERAVVAGDVVAAIPSALAALRG